MADPAQFVTTALATYSPTSSERFLASNAVIRGCKNMWSSIGPTSSVLVRPGQHIHVGTPKAHKQRSVPLPEFLVPYLARQCEGKDRDGLLWPGARGDHLRRPHPTSGWFAKA